MKRDELNRVFSRLSKLRALVIGDLMIDAYFWGAVKRISPEAPVPVVEVSRKESRLGGAANVALNIQALGAKASLIGVLGNDPYGDSFKNLLEEKNLNSEGLVIDESRPTTVKTRVLGGNQQIIRVDEESTKEVSRSIEKELRSKLDQLLPESDVVILEDYNKGLLGESFIQYIIEECSKNNIPVCVDPKKENFFSFKGVDLFKPNLKEVKEGLNWESFTVSKSNLDELDKQLRLMLKQKYSLITLSEKGVYISDGKNSEIIPAHLRSISDVSGAGDTVISMAALCLSLGIDMKDIARLSNLAGGQVCEKVGVVSVDRDQLYSEALIAFEG